MIKKLFLPILIVLVLPTFAWAQDTQQQLNKVESAATSSAQKASVVNTSFVEGVVRSANVSVYTLDTTNGSRFIYTTDTTKFVNIDSTGKKLIGFGDIKLGDQVMVLGIVATENSGVAKFVVRDQVKQIPTFSFFGTIKTSGNQNITVANFSNADLAPVTLTLNTETALKDSGDTNLLAKDLLPTDKIIAAGTIDDKGNLVTKTILKLLPSLSGNSATSSAK